jgi:copper homeostasis protein
MKAVRKKLGIPIHILVRPHAGDFLYSSSEFERMHRDIRRAKELGMDGIVLGLLDKEHFVDVRRTSELVKAAHPLPVTFHRAFDLRPDRPASLQAVIDTGAARLLTSGGKANACDGLSALASLVETAGERIVIMPGGGVRAGNVERILRRTGAQEIHSSLGIQRTAAPGTLAGEFEVRVRRVRRLLDALPC